MSKQLIGLLLGLALVACRKGEDLPVTFYDCQFAHADSSAAHPDAVGYRAVLDDMTEEGVVGVTMSVYHTATGMWSGASGMADLHNGVPMKPCNISRVGSTVKTFTATTVLLLAEEGRFDLDDPISCTVI